MLFKNPGKFLKISRDYWLFNWNVCNFFNFKYFFKIFNSLKRWDLQFYKEQKILKKDTFSIKLQGQTYWVKSDFLLFLVIFDLVIYSDFASNMTYLYAEIRYNLIVLRLEIILRKLYMPFCIPKTHLISNSRYFMRFLQRNP